MAVNRNQVCFDSSVFFDDQHVWKNPTPSMDDGRTMSSVLCTLSLRHEVDIRSSSKSYNNPNNHHDNIARFLYNTLDGSIREVHPTITA
jgi:hypothetical protein